MGLWGLSKVNSVLQGVQGVNATASEVGLACLGYTLPIQGSDTGHIDLPMLNEVVINDTSDSLVSVSMEYGSGDQIRQSSKSCDNPTPSAPHSGGRKVRTKVDSKQQHQQYKEPKKFTKVGLKRNIRECDFEEYRSNLKSGKRSKVVTKNHAHAFSTAEAEDKPRRAQ